MEPSVKTLRSPLSAEFSWHFILSGGTQRRAFALVQSRRNNNSLPRVGIEPTTVVALRLGLHSTFLDPRV